MSVDCSAAPPTTVRDVVVHGAQVIAFNSAIALTLVVVGASGGGWWPAFAYSQAIGLSIWVLIEAGRVLLTLRTGAGWPRGWRAVPLTLGSIAVGFLIGNWIGDRLTGQHALTVMLHDAAAARIWVGVTVIAGAVATSYFYAAGRIAAQQAEIGRTARDASQARLVLLQSQLQPHMLFNTLANLRALITVDPQRALTMLDHLDGYLRTSLSMSKRVVHPLRAEFDGLHDYLELMAVRMGPRLRYRLDLPDVLADWPVPPLLLQPVVENAVIHGLEPSVDGGTLTVVATREGDGIRLEVTDAGVGLGAEAGTQGTGFGLAQLRQRLTTLYGAEAGVAMRAGPDGGTRVRIVLPRRTITASAPING